jgi:hypothetical protein
MTVALFLVSFGRRRDACVLRIVHVKAPCAVFSAHGGGQDAAEDDDPVARSRRGLRRGEVDTVCCKTVQGRTVPRLEFGGGTRVRLAELLGPRSYRVTQQQIWILLLTDLVSRCSDFRLTLLDEGSPIWKPG